VALLVDGKEVARKPLTLVADPQVMLTAEQRLAYNALANELHAAQQAGAAAAAPLAALNSQMRAVAAKVDSAASLPADVKAEFAQFRKDFDALRAKFGVGVPAIGGPGGGGGFGGGGAGNDANVLGRVGQAKSNVLAVWELPSDALRKQADAAKTALAAAVAEANAFVPKARALSGKLAASGIMMNVGN
jgi:hypothetical protein